MKVALFGDVHANIEALRLVVRDARKRKVEAFWNTGDSVCHGPCPNEVLDLLRELGGVNVLGNLDREVLRFLPQPSGLQEFGERSPHNKRKSLPFSPEWTAERLSDDNRRFLLEFPLAARMRIGEWRVLLIHESPSREDKRPVYPDTDPKRFSRLAQEACVDIVLMGHSHVPFCKQVDGVWFVNPGSVGRPLDGDPRPSYALLFLDEEDFKVEGIRLDAGDGFPFPKGLL